jgi:hypothetical protein
MHLAMKNGLLLFLGCFLTNLTLGQGNRVSEYNSVGWYTYTGDHKLAKRWELHTEYQWRRIDFIRAWQQSLARVGLIYSLNDRVKVSGGYTNFVTYPYGRYPASDQGVPVPENRIYQDIELTDQHGRLAVSHRFRLEQRWLAQLSETNPRKVASWEYQNRVRYQVSLTYPLSGPTINTGEFYLNAFDELFISFGRNVGNNVYNQNRISAGLGYQIRDNLKVELNYFNRILQHAEPEPLTQKPIFDYDNGFRLNVNYDIDFTGKNE